MNRPGRRVWLLIAGVLLAGSVAAGVAVALAPEGTVDQRFRADRSITVVLDQDTPLVVWSRSTAEDIECTPRERVSSDNINVQVYGRYTIRSGDETLYAVLDVRADPAGTYELVCTGDVTGVGAAPWRYQVQRRLPIGGPSSTALIGVAVGLPALLAVVIALSVRRRR